MKKIKILIADDHKIFRDGIRALLREEPEIQIAAEADNGKQVLEKVESQKIDVILMDIQMPELNGIETTEIIKKKFPEVKILALSMYDDDNHIMKMLEAGACGYILKNTDRKEVVTAIKLLASGNSYFCPEASNSVLQQINNQRKEPSRRRKLKDAPLSEREVEVLKLIAEGNTNSAIAKKLFLSIRTIDTHRRNLLRKLNTHNTAGLVRYAFQQELLPS